MNQIYGKPDMNQIYGTPDKAIKE